MNTTMRTRIQEAPGFFAALDQSGGSTPDALLLYGIPSSAYDSPEAMFGLMHAMRVRIITAPAFTSSKVIAAILFERTMDGEVEGQPVPTYLWQQRGVVPFVKVDQGLAAEQDGVRLMKPMPDLDALLRRAVSAGVAGTKMRSTIRLADRAGIAAIVRQQFEVAARIAAFGLLPIVEPEVLIASPDRANAEALLRGEILASLDALPDDSLVLLKLTIPEQPDLYAPLSDHPRVARVLALSGGYSRQEACERLRHNHRMIASFSRALLEDLRVGMSDAAFDAALAAAVDAIYTASVDKIAG